MREPSRAVPYACLYQGLCDIGRASGYAICLHGTMARDLDVVAIPWTDKAISAEDLRSKIFDFIQAYGFAGDDVDKSKMWADKPHGRKAVVMFMEAGYSVDLSVMPRV